MEKNQGPGRGKCGISDTMFRLERTTWQMTLFEAKGGSEPKGSHTLTQIEPLQKEVMEENLLRSVWRQITDLTVTLRKA